MDGVEESYFERSWDLTCGEDLVDDGGYKLGDDNFTFLPTQQLRMLRKWRNLSSFHCSKGVIESSR